MWHKRRNTLTTFKNTVNTNNSDCSSTEGTADSLNFSAPGDGRVGRNMWCCDEFLKGFNFKSWYCLVLAGKQLKINSNTNCDRLLRYNMSLLIQFYVKSAVDTMLLNKTKGLHTVRTLNILTEFFTIFLQANAGIVQCGRILCKFKILWYKKYW
jgi:hypothetical protein